MPPSRLSRARDRLLPGIVVTRGHAESYAAAWARTNEAALQGDDRPLWVALGDSMSQGVGASTFEGAWVNQAQRSLARQGRDYRVVNLSATGATTVDVVERQLLELRRLEPDLVTLLIGANDMLRPSRRRGLVDRFAVILEALPRGAVVARLPQPVPLAWRVNELIDAESRAGRLVAVDMRPAARVWRGSRAPDLFHPNERGYARIADAFVTAILAAGPGRAGRPSRRS